MCADAEVSSSCFAAERVVEDRLDSATNVLAASQQHRWRLLDDSLWTLRQHSEKPDPALAVLRTLFDQPRWVDPSYLYDDRGSDLFEEISQLPEYYLTRLEDGILEQEAANIVAAAPRGVTGISCLTARMENNSRKAPALSSRSTRTPRTTRAIRRWQRTAVATSSWCGTATVQVVAARIRQMTASRGSATTAAGVLWALSFRSTPSPRAIRPIRRWRPIAVVTSWWCGEARDPPAPIRPGSAPLAVVHSSLPWRIWMAASRCGFNRSTQHIG